MNPLRGLISKHFLKYVYAEELAKRMKKLGRKDLAAKCYQFIKNVYSEEQNTLTKNPKII